MVSPVPPKLAKKDFASRVSQRQFVVTRKITTLLIHRLGKKDPGIPGEAEG